MIALFLMLAPAFASPDAERFDPETRVATMERVLDLGPHERVEAAELLDRLQAHDPWTRVAIELAFLLDAEVPVKPAFASVRQRIDTQVAVLKTLEVEDPALDLATVRAHVDALAKVDHLDADPADADRLEALTGIRRPCPRGPWAPVPGHPWTMGMELNDVANALRELPAHEPALLATLDAWARVSQP